MDIKRKLEIVEQAVDSIAGHGDEDANVRKAALDHVVDMIGGKKAAIDAEVAARIAETLKD